MESLTDEYLSSYGCEVGCEEATYCLFVTIMALTPAFATIDVWCPEYARLNTREIVPRTGNLHRDMETVLKSLFAPDTVTSILWQR